MWRRSVTSFLVSNLEGAGAVLESLSRAGLHAKIYGRSVDDDLEDQPYREKSEQTGVWIGSKVQADVAVLSIKSVVKIWPHLCHLSISGDHGENPPEESDYEMFFGGATRTAINEGLRKWTSAEIAAIPDHPTLNDFHNLIRTKYANKQQVPEF